MKITPRDIDKIENLIEEDYTVEIRVLKGSKPPFITIFKRPDQACDIKLPTCQITSEQPGILSIVSRSGGTYPAEVALVDIPAWWWIAGVNGYTRVNNE